MIDRRLLIVDDDRTVLYSYKRLFKFAGVEVDTARSLDKALTFMKKKDYRAVVSDLNLKGENGLEGLEVLRRVKHMNMDTKRILITAYGSFNIKEKARELGIDYYFEKPVPIDNLIKILRVLTC